MKTLFLVRHAKSSWENPGLSDEERPLNPRGERDAPRMGKRLAAREVKPDILISSPALRAHSTSIKIAAEIGYPVLLKAAPGLFALPPVSFLKACSKRGPNR